MYSLKRSVFVFTCLLLSTLLVFPFSSEAAYQSFILAWFGRGEANDYVITVVSGKVLSDAVNPEDNVGMADLDRWRVKRETTVGYELRQMWRFPKLTGSVRSEKKYLVVWLPFDIHLDNSEFSPLSGAVKNNVMSAFSDAMPSINMHGDSPDIDFVTSFNAPVSDDIEALFSEKYDQRLAHIVRRWLLPHICIMMSGDDTDIEQWLCSVDAWGDKNIWNSLTSEGVGSLHVAVMAFQNASTLDLLLKKCPVNYLKRLCTAQDCLGWTPLHLAARYRDVSRTKKIVSSDPYQQNSRLIFKTTTAGCTALHHAAGRGEPGHICSIVEAVTNLREKQRLLLMGDIKGYTALHFAVRRKSVKHAQAVLQSCPDGYQRHLLFAETDKGETALHLASQSCSLEMVQLIATTMEEAGCLDGVINKSGTAITQAGCFDSVMNKTSINESPVMLSLKNSLHPEVTPWLLQNGGGFSVTDYVTHPFKAIKMRKILRSIIRRNRNINADEYQRFIE